MKNNTITIIKKELTRFFSDKRMVLTTVLMPGLMIYIMYSFMGSALTSMNHTSEDYVPQISVVAMPDSVAELAKQAKLPVATIDDGAVSDIKDKIANKEADLLVVFPDNFDAEVAAFEASTGGEAPKIEVYYNRLKTESASTYMAFTEILSGYESDLANKFDVNPGEGAYNLATDKDTTGKMFSSMLPMLMMIFLFSGCIAIAPEAISGEKERGTIATLLITPMKRSELALGKITALAVIALLSGVSSTLGTMISLPKIMGGEANMSAAAYGAGDYLMLAAVILSTVLVLITLISIISTYAKTIKEAQSAVMPLMIIVMLIGVTAMFGDGAKTEMFYYLIPLYNSVQCMVSIFSFEIISTHVLITAVVNLAISGIGVFVLTKMFSNENIMFKK